MAPVRITATSGSITVTAEARNDVVVDQGQHHPMGGVLEVKGTSSGVVMRVPIGTDVIVGTSSGAVALKGQLGDVRVATGSGRIGVECCASIDVRTMSGSVDIDAVTGDARIKTASGGVKVQRVAGELNVASVSGRIAVADATGPVRANTVKGSVELGLTRAVDAHVDSVSGAVTIDIPTGVHPNASLVSVSGGCSCEAEPGNDCSVTGRSVSGRITVRTRR